MKITQKKKIFILLLSLIGLAAATVTPIILFANKNENKTIEKDIVAYANKLKKLSTKEVTVSATSGDITTNKNIILKAIKALDNFPKVPSGIILEVKDDATILNDQWTQITLIVKKQGKTDLEVTGFKVKRSQSDQEIVDAYFNKLNILPTKEVVISASLGDVNVNKNAILSAIKTLTNFPTTPSGINLEIKNNNNDLTLQGVPITLVIKKGIITKEISGFIAKRSQTDQEIASDYKNRLEKSFRVFSGPIPLKQTIKINSETGTIEENKAIIINKIKNSYEFIFPPTGFDIRLKADQNQEITLAGIMVDIEIFKIDTQNTLAASENFLRVKRSQNKDEFKSSSYEKIKNHFLIEGNKNIGIPFESRSKTYTSLTQDGVLEAVKKALTFSDPIFWTKSLLNKIALRGNKNPAVTNFDTKKAITIKYGAKGNKSSVLLQVQKYSKKETITKYFEYKDNKNIIIPFNVADSTSADSILEKVKNVLLYKNTELWQTLQNYLYVSNDNKLNNLEPNPNDNYYDFKISYGSESQDSQRKKLILKVKHFTDYQQIKDYFEDQKNRKINIPSITLSSEINTANKILEKIKVYLSIKNSSIWTKELKDKIKISASNQTTSLAKGDFPKQFIVEYTNGPSTETIILKVKHSEK